MQHQLAYAKETIAAIATPPGRGGIGIIRVSGTKAKCVAERITQRQLTPNYATFCRFRDANNTVVDEGIAIFFPSPHSFTGEDTLELQCHGSPVILNCLLKEIIALGAKLAKPGEFSERAYLNDKISLNQAEAIADLIASSTEQAARNAVRSLQGAFSDQITHLVECLINLRTYVEAAIDFPEEEVDFLSDGKIKSELESIISHLSDVQQQAKQGVLLNNGITVVIAGRPNAGKSSLLNALSGKESAIVTPIEGTTRDVIHEQLSLDGLPVHIIDTAGLRDSPNPIEQEGIRRAWSEINNADQILLVVDSTDTQETELEKIWPEFTSKLSTTNHITIIHNKTDLSGLKNQIINQSTPVVALSATQPHTLALLKQHLKQRANFDSQLETGFIARQRHLDALKRAKKLLNNGLSQLNSTLAGELVAEDLREAQYALSEITGEFTTDDLLGNIFSSFCIGK